MDPVALRAALEAAEAAHAQATRALEAARQAVRTAGVAVKESAPSAPQVLDVERINVRERDGTLRLIIGNSGLTRSLPMRGRELEHPGRFAAAGILFINDEGTESGGLVTHGRASADGPRSLNYLSFDAHEQNETLRLGRSEEHGQEEKFLEFRDAPDWSLGDMIEEAESRPDAEAGDVYEEYESRGRTVSRMLLSRDDDGSVGLRLRDAEGRDRIRLIVSAEGEASIELVNADGTATSL